MSLVTVNTKIDSKDKEKFEAIINDLGLTQSVVLRNFVKTFNSVGGFPYEVKYSAFLTEEELVSRANDFKAGRNVSEHELIEE